MLVKFLVSIEKNTQRHTQKHACLHSSVHYMKADEEGFLSLSPNKQGLSMHVRTYVRTEPACMPLCQSAFEGRLGRGGWTATSVVSAGMSDGASPQVNAHMWIPARRRETDKRGEKGKDGGRGACAVIHGSSSLSEAAIDVASAVRVTGG